MNIVFRTDASINIGTGHVMRCLTLASALRDRGECCSFICRDHPGNLVNLIHQQGFKVDTLITPSNQPINKNSVGKKTLFYEEWLGVHWQRDVEQTKNIIGNQFIDWLIVDHYALDSRWEEALKPFYQKLMVIDDLADRLHSCDLLLDQNYYPDMNTRYKKLISRSCISLIGPEHALLRPEFKEARSNIKLNYVSDEERIFIFFGGSDPTNETGKALNAIKLLNLKNIKIDVVVGGTNLNYEEINRASIEMRDVTIYQQVSNIAELMNNASLAIGAGGLTSWERCCVGLPSIVWCIAENQIALAEYLDEVGVCVNLGRAEFVTPEIASMAISNLLNKKYKRLKMKKKCLKILDGEGAPSVLKKINIKL